MASSEAERDAALGDENSVGNVISGAIAAHEIIPEIMPGQRKAEEIEDTDTSANAAAEPAEVYEVTAEEEQVSEADFATMPAAELERQLAIALKSDTRKNYRQVSDMYREYELKLASEKEISDVVGLSKAKKITDFYKDINSKI